MHKFQYKLTLANLTKGDKMSFRHKKKPGEYRLILRRLNSSKCRVINAPSSPIFNKDYL